MSLYALYGDGDEESVANGVHAPSPIRRWKLTT